MTSSSSSHHYDVAFGPLEDDLLWMQKIIYPNIFGMVLMIGR